MTEEKQVTEDFKPQETRRIMKNVVIIGVAFMVHFTAYGGAAILQSSINAEAGLGTASLAAVYAGFTFSSIFLPALVIKWFGTKWVICLSFVTYMPYIVAQFYPTFYTLVPAGLLVGLGAGPLWCAKDTYLSVVSDAYSRITKVSSEVILPRFLGLFFMIFQVNVGGNLISSFLLSSGDNVAAHTALNATTIPELCGANFLPNVDAGQALQQQPREKILMLNGTPLTYAGLLVLSSGDNVAAHTALNATTIPELCGANFLPNVDAGQALQQQPREKILMLNGTPLTYAGLLVLSSGDNVAAHTALNATTIPELCGANFLPNVDAGQALQQQPREKILMLNGTPLTYAGLLVLSSGDNVAAHTALNATTIPELCGANFLPNVDAGQALQQQPREKILMLNGIYLAFMVGAVIIVGVGVDSMKRYDSVRDGIERLSGMDLLSATLKLMVEPKHMMLIILNISVGYQQAFLEADFTAAFVSCIIGTGSVGFVMVTFGLTNAVGCLLTGYIVKMTGRVPVICCSMAVLAALMVALLVWRPQEGQAFVIYAIAVIWGFCDSVWRVHITAFGRTLFPGREEALFSNFSLWGSVGFIIAYVSSPYLRTSQKTYFMLAAMTVGVTLYCILEYRERGTKEISFDKEVPTESGCVNKGFQSLEL